MSSYPFAFLLYGTTGIPVRSTLNVQVYYAFNSSVPEDMPFRKPLVRRNTGEEIFKMTNWYMGKHGLSWSQVKIQTS